jgi:outer membrane protein OmpA-like peptidoglycan-associated protein
VPPPPEGTPGTGAAETAVPDEATPAAAQPEAAPAPEAATEAPAPAQSQPAETPAEAPAPATEPPPAQQEATPSEAPEGGASSAQPGPEEEVPAAVEPAVEPAGDETQDAPQGDDAAAGTGAEAPAAEVPVTEVPATDAPVTDTPVTDVPVTDAPVTDVPAAEVPVTDVPATDAPATDAPATDAPVDETPVDETPVTETPVAEVPELPVQPEAETGAPPVAEATALPADAGTGAPAPEGVVVTEEVVTDEAVRSSAEDFGTKVGETVAPATAAALAAAAAPAAEQDDDDDGLSDLEKALLVGVGALAIGAIISNNRRVAANSGDRVVVERGDGTYQIIKDDDAILRQPGDRVRTERFQDGSTRTTVTRADGTRIVTIRDAEYRVLRRVQIDGYGRQTVLFDDTLVYEPVVVSELPAPPRTPRIPRLDDELALRLALEQEAGVSRAFSLAQVRDIAEVRNLVPVIDLDTITFDTGSAAISPDQARALSTIGRVIADMIAADPREVFLIEGHTDAVGSAAFNLALSDRRAESVALALTEYFAIPPENLVVQGYGEAFLKVDTQGDERANRRASVRRITDLLQQAQAN